MTDPCCGLSVIFCGFILHLIGHETIYIPEILSSVHGFMGKTVKGLFSISRGISLIFSKKSVAIYLMDPEH